MGDVPDLVLDSLKPHTAERVEKQLKQKEQHDNKVKERKFNDKENVFIQNYSRGDKWLPGVIQKKTGPLLFLVKLLDGRVRHCHQDQICKHSVEVPNDSYFEPEISDSLTVPTVPSDENPNTTDESRV